MTNSEWIVGLAEMQQHISDGKEAPWRPHVLMWIEAGSELIRDSSIDRESVLLDEIAVSLGKAIAQPMAGDAGGPARIRTASAAVAEALREIGTDIDIVEAATPEFDSIVAMMTEGMTSPDGPPPSLLESGIPAETAAALFEAAASLYRIEPWTRVPDDESLIGISVASLGIEDAVISVIGQLGDSLGFVVFDSLFDFERYLDIFIDFDPDHGPQARLADLPRHLTLNFERGADLPSSHRQEAMAHGWRVADERAWPVMNLIEADLVPHPVTAADVQRFELLCRTLLEALGDDSPLRQALETGEPVTQTLVVDTSDGPREVVLSAPIVGPIVGPAAASIEASIDGDIGPDVDIIEALAGLEPLSPDDDDARFAACHALHTALIRRVIDARHAPHEAAAAQQRYRGCELVFEMAASIFGKTVVSLAPSELEEIVFDIVPRQVSMPPDAAGEFIEGLRSMYGWLRDTHALVQADDCLAWLDDDAVRELEAALGASGNFGLAKSFAMHAMDDGVDPSDRAAMEAFMRARLPSMPDDDVGMPGFREPSARPALDPAQKRAQDKKRKAKRKQARKARKKGR